MNRRVLGASAAVLVVILGLALLPALLQPPTSTGPACAGSTSAFDADLEAIMATIRQLESGGDYTARSTISTASGAYQFIDSAWGRYDGYPRAWLAPPDVQDRKAAENITAILDGHGGDVGAVPVSWYIGHVPAAGSAEWDTVPRGNRLSPRQYQAMWLDTYRSLIGAPAAPEWGAPDCPAAGPSGPVLPGGWALPGPRELLDANPAAIRRPHHDYPAWDWPIPEGTPIYAIRGGTVTNQTNYAHNCAGRTSCQKCGIGVTITDDVGTRWTYCHGIAAHVTVGQVIDAGQQVLDSGNTGNSTGPHLHLGITTADGVRRCPQPLIAALLGFHGGVPSESLPASGCISVS